MLQSINPYSIVPFVTSFLTLSLGIFTGVKGRFAKPHLLFCLMCFSVTLWTVGLSVFLNAATPSEVILFNKIGHINCTLTPALFLHFSAVLAGSRRIVRLIPVFYGVSFVSIGFMWFSDLYFTDTIFEYRWGSYAKASPFITLDLIVCVLVAVVSFFLMFEKARNDRLLSSLEFNRTKLVILSMFFLALANFDYIPKYGIDMPPIGSIFIALFAITATYAMVRHQMLDIRIILRRTAIYSVLAACITAVYFGLVLLGEKVFQGLLGYDSLVFSLFIGVTIAIGFIPLKDVVQRYVDRLFFRGTQAALAEENERLRQELVRSEKLKAISTFAAGMAHEIKNPLTSIKTFAEFLPEKYDDDKFRQKFSRIMQDEVGRINTIVHRLLDFSKPGKPALKSIRLSEVIGETLEFLHMRLVAAHIQVETRLSSPDKLYADRDQIKQVLLNLLLNSIEAMPSGGQITVTTACESGMMRLIIADSGEGIAKKDLNRVLDPFHSSKQTGTGLGLTVVESIVRNHRGKLSINSEVGVGTTVEIRLPLEQPGVTGQTMKGEINDGTSLNR